MRQAEHSASRSAARLSGMRELRVMIRSAALLGTPASHSLIGGTDRPSSCTLVALLGIEPGTAPPMSSWWPKAWTNATTSPSWKTGTVTQRSGQVADAALGLVDVVVEEDVALVHLVEREVPRDRVHERAVGAAGELAQLAVVDAGAEVVGVTDHGGAGGAGDRGLDLHLDARQGALDDLDEDRVDGAAGSGEPLAVLVCRGQAGRVHRRVLCVADVVLTCLLGDDEVAVGVDRGR